MRIILLALFIATSVQAASWPRGNNPNHFEDDLNYQFSELPIKATIESNFTAWPGNHWASQFGGIAQRWSSGNPQHFSYHRYSLKELKKLETHLIEELSPAEKYDILMGRYDYPTVKKEWSRTSPNSISWFGICHGVAPAALNHVEPQTVTVTNKDGIELLFYSSDVKALMSYYYARHGSSKTVQIGKRCNTPEGGRLRRGQRTACKDMDPAAFHILITNLIGLKDRSLIVDIDPNNEVWNHVPNAYSFDIYEEYAPDETATKGAVKSYWVGMEVAYAGAIAPFFDPVIGLPEGYYIDNNYQYQLDVDAKGNIIGGQWFSDLRPDFVWKRPKIEFQGYWSKINEIYIPRTN